MKIGIYTDVHCSYTSSILPLHQPDKAYTTRLSMIVDSFKFMYEQFESAGVDLIVNCGDLFHSCQVRAEELSAMREALSYGGKIPEYHILGNHEVFDNSRQFFSTALLDNYAHITVISQPTKLASGLSFLPYMKQEEAAQVIPLLENKILFSHIDISGSFVTPTYCLDEGVEPEMLSAFFKLVINGHIHAPQTFGGNVHNIGASTSLSFADNEKYCPRFVILDTDTLNMQYVSNPYAIRFIKGEADSLEDVKRLVESAYPNPCAIRVSLSVNCSKTEAEDYLATNPHVVAHRLLTAAAAVAAAPVETIIETGGESTVSKFRKFIHELDDPKYAYEEYDEILAEMEE